MDLLRSCIALAVLLPALSACDRAAAPSAPAAPAPSAPASSPAAGVQPHAGDIPKGSGATAGPAEGGAAIGGVTGGAQDGSGARSGAPAPTGGDGSTATRPEDSTQAPKSK